MQDFILLLRSETLFILKAETLPSGETIAEILNELFLLGAIGQIYVLTGRELYLILIFLIANLTLLDLVVVVDVPVQIGYIILIELVHKGNDICLGSRILTKKRRENILAGSSSIHPHRGN